MSSEPGAPRGDEPGGELVPFPGYEIEPDVLEGEIVDEPAAVRAGQGDPRRPRRRAARAHEDGPGATSRYIPLGVRPSSARRLWDSRTTARYERWLRRAEADGDQEAALEWEKRLAAFRKDRHQRRVDMIKVPADDADAAAEAGARPVRGAGRLRHRCWPSRPGTSREVAVPFKVVARVAEIVAIVLSVTWGPVVLALPWIALGALW